MLSAILSLPNEVGLLCLSDLVPFYESAYTTTAAAAAALSSVHVSFSARFFSMFVELPPTFITLSFAVVIIFACGE